MLKESALANALAVVTAAFYILLWVAEIVSPEMFRALFNAQFFGANVAALRPRMSFGAFVATLAIVVVTSWVFGYAWAWLYNRFAM